MTTTLIPDSAPFTNEQRAWLNGFLSGYLGVHASADASQVAMEASQALLEGGVAEEDLDDAPWHDSGLPIVDRMQLAEGKPLEHRLMAAMAQLDCGSCGYVCKTYSAAIAAGEETNLTLCSPGGKETKQMLKKLVKEGAAPANENGGPAQPTLSTTSADEAGYSRNRPYFAKLLESRPLNKAGSAKDTRHVAIDLRGSGLRYQVGDALGIFPENCGELVSSILGRLQTDGSLMVPSPQGEKKALRQVLTEDTCLREPTDELLEALLDRSHDEPARQVLMNLLEKGVPEGFDVLDALEVVPEVGISATEFCDLLEPLNPRLYSIASSMRAVGDEVHLTVGKVAYEREGRLRKGVASTMLAERLPVGSRLRVFVQANHGGFTVPADPRKPMIMIGPGTGIAPFMAFLQEREKAAAPGKNWLFFGDQHQAHDFLYEEQLVRWQHSGLLTELETAFSRDCETKVYVQDRMRARAGEIWNWLEEGAYLYVCGDASRMAADVDRALRDIIQHQAGVTTEQAQATIKQLAQEKRYVRDVY